MSRTGDACYISCANVTKALYILLITTQNLFFLLMGSFCRGIDLYDAYRSGQKPFSLISIWFEAPSPQPCRRSPRQKKGSDWEIWQNSKEHQVPCSWTSNDMVKTGRYTSAKLNALDINSSPRVPKSPISPTQRTVSIVRRTLLKYLLIQLHRNLVYNPGFSI